MKTHLILIVFVLIQFSTFNLSAQSDSIETIPIVEYGMPYENVFQNARNIIANKWGIRFEYVGEGCFVSEEDIQQAKRVNEVSHRKLAIKYGKDWKIKFKNEIDREYEILKKLRIAIYKEKYILNLDSTLDKSGNSLYIFFTPKTNDQYKATIYGWGKWNGQSTLVIYYELNITTDTRVIEIISDKIQPLKDD